MAALDSGSDVTSRHEMRGGHVTCGAAVVDDLGRLLLIRHRALGRWLLPGGRPRTGTRISVTTSASSRRRCGLSLRRSLDYAWRPVSQAPASELAAKLVRL